MAAPESDDPGNVRPRAVTLFEFTPSDTGTFTIQHTVHGFSGILKVEDPLTSVGPPVPGDFDDDGVVGQPDFVLFADHFGNTPDDETWDPKYDLGLSGRVDFLDLFIFANNFGKES